MSDSQPSQPPTLVEALAQLAEKYDWDRQMTYDSLDDVKLRAQRDLCRDLMRVLSGESAYG